MAPTRSRSRTRSSLLSGEDSSSSTPLPPDTQTKHSSAPLESGSGSTPATKDASSPSSHASSSDSEDDEDIVRPRGKLASRMQAQSNDGVRSPQANNKEEDVRERVRRMLQAEEKPREPGEGVSEEKVADNEVHNEVSHGVGGEDVDDDEDEDEDEDVVGSRTRRLASRQQRRKRSVTPEGEDLDGNAIGPPSPGLFVSPEKPREDSPGLFVSPSKPQSPVGGGTGSGARSDSDSDLPDKPFQNARFLALVLKKRKARLAREAEEKARRQRAAAADADLLSGSESSDVTDDEGGRKLTQEAARRPTRRAGRKAIEEMSRETQRMSRGLQLAHEARTRKKVTKAALFERFNFRPEGASAAAAAAAAATATAPPVQPSSSSRPSTPVVRADLTDTEMRDVETPPSSPPVIYKTAEPVQRMAVPAAGPLPAGTTVPTDIHDEGAESEDLPTLHAVLEAADAARKKADYKGKGKAMAADLAAEEQEEQEEQAKLLGPGIKKRQIRIRLPPSITQTNTVTLDDADDELVIQQPSRHDKLDAIFERVPLLQQNKESRSLQMLRRLAHLDDPESKPSNQNQNQGNSSGGGNGKTKIKNGGTSMTVGQLQATLVARARQQARQERERRLAELRARGVHVQTAAERENEAAAVEDMVARARREAEEIMAREREAARQQRREKRKLEGDKGGEGDEKEDEDEDPLAWDDSDDESFDPLQTEEEAVIELSGSEEEEEEEGDDEDKEDEKDDEKVEHKGGLIDDAAESTGESEGDEPEEDDADVGDVDSRMEEADEQEEEEDAVPTPKAAARRPRRPGKHFVILSDDEDEDEDDADSMPVKATPRPKTNFPKSPSSVPALNSDSPQVPTSVLRSATKTFIPGLPVTGPAGLGLTQIFAGTMDDSQPGSPGGGSSSTSPTQPMPSFDAFPDSNFSQTVGQGEGDFADDMLITDSQPTQQGETQGGIVQLHLTQSQMHGFGSLLRQEQAEYPATQASELLQPTQDGGFQNLSPLKQRFIEAPASTIETLPVERSSQGGGEFEQGHNNDSPLVRRTGKLRRRGDIISGTNGTSVSFASEYEEADGDGDGGSAKADEFGFGTVPHSAFQVMKAAAAQKTKTKHKAFDKEKSKAREMIEEQAEESEDEYAGLGGVDGEVGTDDDDDAASVQEMIDDETRNDAVDERKLAAFFADRERASDEKQVEKLFRDITTGMLRRKRAHGGDHDLGGLSDSDDGGEARRRMKRRQFAKMQRALFADERISKVAANPRNQAFLRSIEDRGSDDEGDDVIMADIMLPPTAAAMAGHGGGREGQQEGEEEEDSQEMTARADFAIPDSQPAQQQQRQQRPSGLMRRARDVGKKPASLGEIRESLSNLLEEPFGSQVIPATDVGGSDDEEGEDGDAAGISSPNKENHHPRRRRAAVAIVDRIALKRNGSSSLSTMTTVSSTTAASTTTTTSRGRPRLAFATASTASGVFKVPALLRRVTTNGNNHNNNNNNNNTNNSLGSTGGAASSSTSTSSAVPVLSTSTSRRPGAGGASSGVSFFARESERHAALADGERRREARKLRGAEGRARAVGGLFGAGRFE